jgi:membrane protease YdiL (CAAX protease family)
MTVATSLGRIGLAVALYLMGAFGSSVLLQKMGADLKEMKGRTQGLVPLIGLVVNLLVLGLVLLQLIFLDRKPLEVLGFGMGPKVVAFVTITAVATVLLSVGYVRFLPLVSKTKLFPENPRSADGYLAQVLATSFVLLAVSGQEEVLFRGYVISNLSWSGYWGAIALSTLIFVLIHLPTNRPDLGQLAGWVLGGVLLVLVYLTTNSMWAAIAVHLVTDAINVFIFDIAGSLSFFRFEPAMSTWQRAGFRLGQLVLTSALLVTIFGAKNLRLGL